LRGHTRQDLDQENAQPLMLMDEKGEK